MDGSLEQLAAENAVLRRALETARRRFETNMALTKDGSASIKSSDIALYRRDIDAALATDEVCGTCGGSGYVPGGSEVIAVGDDGPCPSSLARRLLCTITDLDHLHRFVSPCSTCHGTGKLPSTGALVIEALRAMDDFADELGFPWARSEGHDPNCGLDPLNPGDCSCGHDQVNLQAELSQQVRGALDALRERGLL